MKKVNINELFYGHIVPEASLGKINVFFNYAIAFSTKLMEYKKECLCKITNSEVMIPTLFIKDRKTFDYLLNSYVDKALSFYDDSNFVEEVLNQPNNPDMIGKEKAIIAHLLANATYEDFLNPVNFLTKRIDFIDNYKEESHDLGYSSVLDCHLLLEIKKDTINNETPAELVLTAKKDNLDFVFPKVKFGISQNKVYIYAIQNNKENQNNLGKKINRKLYKVGEGFTEVANEENLKDITASFLVVLNVAINYFKAQGYSNFSIVSMLPIRYNAKKMVTDIKYANGKINANDKAEKENNLDNIQQNLTNKLIRTCLRLACHYNNISVKSFPYELDSLLHMTFGDITEFQCNNKLLAETGKMTFDNCLEYNPKISKKI